MDHANPRRWWFLPTAALAAAALVTSSVPAYADGDGLPGREATTTTVTAAPVTDDLTGLAPTAGSRDPGAAVDDAEAVTEYWTAERMERAIPADEPEGQGTGQEPGARASSASVDASPSPTDESDPPTIIAEPAPPADDPADDPAGARAQSSAESSRVEAGDSPTNGKVFFRNQQDGRDYVCSGSAVNSASKRLVITAGHCVHGGPGETWHANWVFAPGYDHGPGTEGTFAAASFRAFDEWITYGASGQGFSSDVALVTTQDNEDGETVADAVGGHGLATGGSREFDASVFGYPVNLDAGERMWTCTGTTVTQQVETFLFPSISGCDFGPGSSGGPWLAEYDDSTGQGYVRSVTSFGPSNSTAYISGPYFDERVEELYAAAEDDGSGETP
ncbi:MULTISPECIES: trypsin-like serine peptidase [Citricoccus]|uniref:trypsin-like serine peptidase n=1 Tax=Citricoccus TaxID=169133 RepID=UPI000255EE50|nr:trypsin-like peptidase domain-containing protein [Citricoccus sp. CH26A]